MAERIISLPFNSLRMFMERIFAGKAQQAVAKAKKSARPQDDELIPENNRVVLVEHYKIMGRGPMC